MPANAQPVPGQRPREAGAERGLLVKLDSLASAQSDMLTLGIIKRCVGQIKLIMIMMF